MYDPLTLSQTKSHEEAAGTEPAADAAPKEKKATTKTTDPAPKDSAGMRKKWCHENVGSTFMNADGAPRSALEQFTTFTNEVCPKLEAEIPSKYTALFAHFSTITYGVFIFFDSQWASLSLNASIPATLCSAS